MIKSVICATSKSINIEVLQDGNNTPTTRTLTEVWLVGHPIASLKSTKLLSKKDVLALFINYKDIKELTIKEAVRATATDVIDVWRSNEVPTRILKHVVKKVKVLFEEWTKLRKNKENKAKQTKTLEEKEQRWKKGLKDLFDIASADGKKDKTNVLKRKQRTLQEETINLSSETEINTEQETETSSVEDYEAMTTKSDKGRQKNIVDAKLSICLDMAKLSNRGAALVLTPAIQSLGHHPANYCCSFSTIRRQRMKHREDIALNLKEEFRPHVPLTVHWDGKILEDITGRETVDRLPILVSGEGVDQLLNVPKLDSGTGLSTASAVYETVESWGISNRIKSMCFDTTASNTGLRKGACILLEQKMNKDMLWLACRHHVLEIMLEAVVMSVMPPSTGPEFVMFKKFRSKWSTAQL